MIVPMSTVTKTDVERVIYDLLKDSRILVSTGNIGVHSWCLHGEGNPGRSKKTSFKHLSDEDLVHES